MTDHAKNGGGAEGQARAEAEATRLLERRERRRRASGPVFEPGQLVAGRYRVLDAPESGGAGQVFRVVDEELGQRVALKTLHPGAASSPAALERFKQEVRLARAVTHENVCRLFELGRHGGAGDAAESVLFLTMELIEGETLADLVASGSPLAMEQVVEIGEQVARGLQAAHREGVVHRDLKGQNVLVERRGTAGLRAVVSDFGLAVAATSEPGGGADDAPLVGTPLTMAPEQVKGEAVGPAADIYAFGLLLYHLATGAWPFAGSTALDAAVRRLEQAPAPPSRHRPDLPAPLEALILDCLERQPADRPASMDEVLGRLSVIGKGASGKPTFLRSRRAAGLLAGCLIASSVALGLYLTRGGAPVGPSEESSSEPAAQTEGASEAPVLRPSLLWLGITSSPLGASEEEWLLTLVEEGLEASLAVTGDLRLVAGERAERIRRELGDLGGERLPAERLARLRRRAGVNRVLVGWAEDAGEGRLRLTLHLDGGDQRGEGGMDTLISGEDLPGLGDRVSDLASEIRARLAVAEPDSRQRSAARAEIPRDPVAAKLYAQGLSALRRFETRRAADLLEASLEAEADHPKVLASLSTAWMQLGHGTRARELAARAFEAAGGLSRAEQMEIEATHRLRERDWDRAERLFTALWEFFPDDLEHGFGVLEAQDRAGRLDEALATLEELRTRSREGLPGGDGARDPSSHRARFDLTESMVAYHQGDYPRSQQAAERARRGGEALGASAILAEALLQEALTRIHTDADLAPVEAQLRQAETLFERLGEPRNLVRARLYLADCAARGDRFPDAEAAYRRAIDAASAISDNSNLDRARSSLAILLDRRGELREGLVLKQQVLQSYRERGVVQGAAIAQENVAISLLKMGRPAEALGQLAEVEARYTELGDRVGLAWSPYYQGRAWLDRGELVLAARLLETAGAAARPAGAEPSKALAAAVDFETARLAIHLDDLEKARGLLEPLVDFYAGLEQPSDVAETKLLLAQVDRREGRLEQAHERARSASDHFAAVGIAPQALAAATELAEIELARPVVTEPAELTATPAGACAKLAVTDLEARRPVLLAAVTWAKCRRGAESPQELLGGLDEIVKEARRLELFLPEMRARVLRAQTLIESGRRGDAEADLESLRREANERGFSTFP